MIDNPHSLLEKQSTKSQKHWWQRIKAILFGYAINAKEPDSSDLKENLKLVDYKREEKSSIGEWMQAIDILQPLVLSLRKAIEPRQHDEFDLELLAANTYLFHVDRLIVKIREYVQQFRFKHEQLTQNNLYSYQAEINQANSAAEQCYQTILQLTALLQSNTPKKLYSDELITQIHALELDTIALGSAVRNLNQSAYKAESMMQLAALEHDLLQSLTQSKPMQTHVGFSENHGLNYNITQTQGEYLRAKAHEIGDLNCYRMIAGFIDIHDVLKKCYVVARKIFVKDALDTMSENIEGLIAAMSAENVDKNKVFYHFNQIFHCVEMIRFNTNRESRCSKNLFDKSKVATQQLRKLCQKHPLGLEYLKEYSAKRVTLVKPK